MPALLIFPLLLMTILCVVPSLGQCPSQLPLGNSPSDSVSPLFLTFSGLPTACKIELNFLLNTDTLW